MNIDIIKHASFGGACHKCRTFTHPQGGPLDKVERLSALYTYRLNVGFKSSGDQLAVVVTVAESSIG